MAMTSKPKTGRRKSHLMSGFDSLTLDPSPRLRRVRNEMSRPRDAAIADVWKSVARAMGEDMSSVTGVVRPDR
jgi:hypothetical protein